MKRIFDNILSIKAKIHKLFHYEAKKSHNSVENNFYGTVNFIGTANDIRKKINPENLSKSKKRVKN